MSKGKIIKVKLIEDCLCTGNQKEYNKGECVKVEIYPNSDFYHIWNGNKLDLIKKSSCIILNNNK